METRVSRTAGSRSRRSADRLRLLGHVRATPPPTARLACAAALFTPEHVTSLRRFFRACRDVRLGHVASLHHGCPIFAELTLTAMSRAILPRTSAGIATEGLAESVLETAAARADLLGAGMLGFASLTVGVEQLVAGVQQLSQILVVLTALRHGLPGSAARYTLKTASSSVTSSSKRRAWLRGYAQHSGRGCGGVS
jgi:hypothetical protein